MEVGLLSNRVRTRLSLWQKMLALLCHTTSPIAAKRQSPASRGSCAGISHKKGEFHFITKGKRSYLTLELGNGSHNRLVIGLGQGEDEAWIRKVNTTRHRCSPEHPASLYTTKEVRQ